MVASMASRGKMLVKTSLGSRPKRMSPKNTAIYYCKAGLDQEGLEQRYISKRKGIGVFATQNFEMGDFLLEYVGVLQLEEEKMDFSFTKSPYPRCYTYYFRYNEKSMCLDASRTVGRLGRLVNDAREGTEECNCKMKILVVGSPRLVLFATTDIKAGEELQYDYGEDDVWWRQRMEPNQSDIEDNDPFDIYNKSEDNIVTNSGDDGENAVCDVGGDGGDDADDGQADGDGGGYVEGFVGDICVGNGKECHDDIISKADDGDSVSDDGDSNSSDTPKVLKNNHGFDYDDCDSPVDTKNVESSEGFSSRSSDVDCDDEDMGEDFVPSDGGGSASSDIGSVCGDANSDLVCCSHSSDGRTSPDIPFAGNGLKKFLRNNEDDCRVTSTTCDVATADVATASKNLQGRRVFDKRNYCMYCEKPFAKLARHLQQMHASEIEVAHALSFNLKSQERRTAFAEITKKGNFSHNRAVLSSGTGSLVPVRRPAEGNDSDCASFLPCENCLGFYSKNDLWRHAKSCAPARQGRKHHQRTSAALLPVAKTADPVFHEKILNTLSTDAISLVARTDNDIVSFGKKLFMKCAQNPRQFQYVRCKMRELGRFLLEMRKLNRVYESLRACIKPSAFPDVLLGVKLVSSFNEEDSSFKTPSLAVKLGISLKKCAENLKATAIMSGDKQLRKQADDFILLVESDWNINISVSARETLTKRTFNNPKRLPLTEDLKKLNSFLEKESEEKARELIEKPCPSTWKNFAEVCLAQLVLFNRRRGGETEAMQLAQYLKGMSTKSDLQGEIAKSLSPFEIDLAKQMSRVELRGKRGRAVAVLLTKSMKKNIDILNQYRDHGNIKETNMYLFARQGSAETPLRSSDVMRKFSVLCGASQPELITSTALRKHIATVSQILNLKDHELDCLANFMGHDVRIHRQYYRLPDETVQLAKISKLLLNLEQGKLHVSKGMSLEDINVDDQLETEDDQLETDNDELEIEEEMEGSTEKQMPQGGKSKGKTQTQVRRPWTQTERDAVQKYLGGYFTQIKLPGKLAIEAAKLKAGTVLMRRTWQQIKFFIKNHKKVLMTT